MDTRIRVVDRKLREMGYVFVRQSGSHMLYKHNVTGATVIVPSARGFQGGAMRLSSWKRMLKRAASGAKS